MPALYSLRNITRRFGEREVLRIDALDIAPEEIYALLGANGAGKSTLMRILAFLDAPSGGELFFRGEKAPAGQEARFRPGVVWAPQFPLMFTGSLLYNIEYPMSLKNIARRERRRRAMELLESVRLEHLAGAPARGLSGGEAQRASIARALAAGAHTILFDEPTANVDQRSSGDFIALVRELRERQRLSIIITTHNAALAAALCRRRIFLADGRLVRRQMLPDGIAAWPATLTAGGSGAEARIGQDAAGELPAGTPFPRDAVLRGLEDLAGGTRLHVEPLPGHRLDILLEDENSRTLARSCTLGSVIRITVAAQTRERE
jgi:ABC-type multidrug transport system ATPase subunit